VAKQHSQSKTAIRNRYGHLAGSGAIQTVSTKSNSIWIGRQLFPNWKRISAGMLCALLSALFATTDPLLMRYLIDTSLPGHHLGQALLLVAGIAGAILARGLFLVGSIYLNFSVQQSFAQGLRTSILEQMNRLSADYHEQTPAGDKVTRLEGDVEQISELGADITSGAVRSVILLIANALIMMRLNARITLALVPSVLFFLWMRSRFRVQMQQKADFAQSQTSHAASVLYEHLAALPQLQLLCAESLLMKKAVSVWTGMLDARTRQRRTELAYSLSVHAAIVLATFLVLTVGSTQVLRNALTIGGLVAFYTYATRIFDPVASMMELYSRAQRVGASVRRVRTLLDLESTVPDTGSIGRLTGITHGIKVHNVSFSYKADRYAIRNLSLQIAPGERLAIAGFSGSGKSTLARLLVRLADPNSGQITLESVPLAEYSLDALRRTICYVPQAPVLFEGTIRDNLLYADPTATDQDLDNVLEVTQLAKLMRHLPSGLDTGVGPTGHALSGGERQRFALARALLRKTPVLVLDESTSALDIPTERSVLESVARHSVGSTLIIISHRLASLHWTDRIVILSSGQIAAIGTHATLHEQSPLYRRLYQSPQAPTVN
jgi:ABC-type bacteriocin/lantibiotic exporter with double-glycine peptidase domain